MRTFCAAMHLLTFFLAAAAPLASSAPTPSASVPACLDPSGKPVDWWFAYKFHGGTDFAFASSSAPPPPGPLRLTGLALDAATSPLARTLQQLIDARASLARVQWNDELPAAALGLLNASSGTSGHTKGVLAAGAGGGIFLTHTLPKAFDLTGAAFSWGGASTLYGQNFLCLSLTQAMADTVALGLQYNDPHTYDSFVPAALTGALPNTVALVAGQRKEGTLVNSIATTPQRIPFTQFCKSGSTGVDVYEDVIQPALKSDMWVETWRRAPVMDTYCRPLFDWDSMNVQALLFVDASGANVTWKYTQDHSKVAIAAPGAAYKSPAKVVCVGDMNRCVASPSFSPFPKAFAFFYPPHHTRPTPCSMTSQWVRGGGTTCIVHEALWSALADSFDIVDAC